MYKLYDNSSKLCINVTVSPLPFYTIFYNKPICHTAITASTLPRSAVKI